MKKIILIFAILLMSFSPAEEKGINLTDSMKQTQDIVRALQEKESVLVGNIEDQKKLIELNSQNISALRSEFTVLSSLVSDQKITMNEAVQNIEKIQVTISNILEEAHQLSEQQQILLNQSNTKFETALKDQSVTAQKQMTVLQDQLESYQSSARIIYVYLVLIFLFLILSISYLYWFFNKKIDVLGGQQSESLLLEKLLPLTTDDDSVEDTEENKAIITEQDHSFALKMADEITRLQSNISRIDQETKGLKPIMKGIERIQTNLLAHDYEITDLVGQKYDEGLVVDVINFIDSDELESGVRVITKVIRPQVIYNGKLIQRAQVEVTQN